MLHGTPLFDLQMPLGFKVRNLPMTRHEGQCAGNFAGIDVALQMGAKARQTWGREADFFRFNEHDVSSRSMSLQGRRTVCYHSMYRWRTLPPSAASGRYNARRRRPARQDEGGG